MWMEDKLKKWVAGISKSERVAVICTFLCTILAHLYLWTNTIPNFDGISRMYEVQQNTLYGRWSLHYSSYLYSFTQMPMVIGVLVAFFLAITVFFIVRLFELKSSLLAGMWGCLIAVFPALAYTSTHTYTVAAYMFSAALTAFSVWLVRKYKLGIIPAALILAYAMGTYQAYVCVAICICLLLVIQDMLKAEIPWIKAVLNGVRFVVFIILGTVIYYIVLQIFLEIKDLEMISYLGIDEIAGGYPLDMLGSILAKTYGQVGEFLFVKGADNTFNYGPLIALHVVLLLVGVVLLVRWVLERKMQKDILRLISVVLLLALLPLAVNFIQVMTPLSTPFPHSKFTFVFLYFLPVLLADMCGKLNWKGIFAKVTEAVLIVAVLFQTVYFWQYDNVLYTALNQAHRATLTYATNLLSRVESCEGYQYGMEVVVVGGFPADRYDTDLENYKMIFQGGVLTSSVLPLNKHIYYYFNDWLNVPIGEPAEETFLRLTATQEFQEMPLYPNDGSVRIIDNCVVVKVQPVFTPKADYEKQYEQRR